ncbi:MAG: hypothetical protein IPK26_08720 [Planctomycetes bacterium]|nr:hypothetical protein [Planctomycetota bacterium]
MLRAHDGSYPFDRDEPGTRLHLLLRRWRAEELTLRAELAILSADAERALRDAIWSRPGGEPIRADDLARCQALQTAVDDLAIELSHVRLAVLGASEELMALRDARVATALAG